MPCSTRNCLFRIAPVGTILEAREAVYWFDKIRFFEKIVFSLKRSAQFGKHLSVPESQLENQELGMIVLFGKDLKQEKFHVFFGRVEFFDR